MVLSSFFLNFTNPINSSIVLLIILGIFLFLFSDKVSSSLEAIWDDVTEEFYEPAIDLTTNISGHINKSKHYLMTIQFLREQVEAGLIQLNKVPTEQNIANVLTKIISAPEFFLSFHKIMGINNGSNNNDDDNNNNK
jgi:hypothetical protein